MGERVVERLGEHVVGSVVSVNVGMPRFRDFPGGPIASGIDKRPIAGRTIVRRLNLEGDAQGDLGAHGGEQRAVLAYDASNYAYWQEHAGLRDLPYGAFGENLTVDGLTDDIACVGDRFKIGTAVLEVTQPRATCFRLGAHLGVRDLPRLFVERGRPGFYLRVLAEGELAAGDAIVLLERGRHAISVVAVDKLLYSAERPAEQLAQVLDVPALPAGWRTAFKDLLVGRSNDAAGRRQTTLAWEGWRTFRVTEKHGESDVDMSIRFRPTGDAALAPFEPGQFVSVRLPANPTKEQRALLRPWTLSDRPNDDGWRITVRRAKSSDVALPAGLASAFVHDTLRVGDKIEIAAPRGEFTLRAVPPGAPVVFVTAGIGITPAMAMLEALLAADGPLARDVVFVHGARSERDLPFAPRLASLRDTDPRLRIAIHLSQPPPDRPMAAFQPGRVSPAVLGALDVPTGAHWFICGPTAFQKEIVAGLAEAGIATSDMHVESFRSGAPLAAGAADAAGAALVTFARSNIALAWNGSRFPTLLDFAEGVGVPVAWSCRAGVCHLCQTRVLKGRVSYLTSPPDRPEPNQALLCCSVPDGDLVLDS